MPKAAGGTHLENLLTVRLDAYLKKHRLSRGDFAQKAHVSLATVGNILNGKGRPSKLMVERIEAAMRDEAPPPPVVAEVPTELRDQVDIVLDKATTKGALDKLIQHIFRTTGSDTPEHVRAVAEMLIASHLVRFEGKDKVKEVFTLYDLVRDGNA